MVTVLEIEVSLVVVCICISYIVRCMHIMTENLTRVDAQIPIPLHDSTRDEYTMKGPIRLCRALV